MLIYKNALTGARLAVFKHGINGDYGIARAESERAGYAMVGTTFFRGDWGRKWGNNHFDTREEAEMALSDFMENRREKDNWQLAVSG